MPCIVKPTSFLFSDRLMETSLPTPSVSPIRLQILATAVREARDRRIRAVADLRRILRDQYPSCDADIDAALMLWAGHEARKRMH